MGWLKKKFKQVQKATGLDSLKGVALNLATAGVYGATNTAAQALDEASRVTGATAAYQDVSGHTAKAAEDTRMRLAVANAKALAEANSEVNKDTADVVLGATDDTAGESLDVLRKRKQITGASMVGIV